ncbi:Coleoptile phototropism protein 1 [Linum perenne]
MKKISPSAVTHHHPPPPTTTAAAPCWFDDACILDMDYFVKTITGIKSKGVRPDLIGSIIAHYASKWLPELSPSSSADNSSPSAAAEAADMSAAATLTAQWMKKRFFVETLVGILPGERDSVPCSFLLRLLRTANMVGAESSYVAELEARVAWQLDGASLKELMIPSFSHTCGTVLDVELVTRLVKMFVSVEEVSPSSRSRAAEAAKVGKLVDGYLAEVAVDSNLGLLEFVSLAAALPHHARTTDDGLYRAIDTYLKAHPGLSKQERKNLCRLIDIRKLSPEASFHASQNERLPVRVAIQVLFAEQTKLNKSSQLFDCSSGGSFHDLNMTTTRSSPKPGSSYNYNNIVDQIPSTRCHSKREMNAQQAEIRKLKEDVLRLQSQCLSMQSQMGRMVERKRGGYVWKKLGFLTTPFKSGSSAYVENHGEGVNVCSLGRETPVDMKAKLVRKRTTPPRWRKSMS